MRRLAFQFALLLSMAATCHAAQVAILRNGFSVIHDHREVHDDQTRLFLDNGTKNYLDVMTSDIESFDVAPDPPVVVKAKVVEQTSAPDLATVVRTASSKTLIDVDLLWSVIHAESNMNPHAISRKGASGLMQLMPDTANKLGVQDIFDPTQNVDGGSRYLQMLLDRYHDDMKLALAAYNAGPQRVAQYHGVPPYHETRAYVARIIREFNRRKLEAARQAKLQARQQKTHPTNVAQPTEATLTPASTGMVQ
jgi:hypothetical protein